MTDEEKYKMLRKAVLDMMEIEEDDQGLLLNYLAAARSVGADQPTLAVVVALIETGR